MIRYLLASHGRFASGILDSLTMILGKQDRVEAFCAYTRGETDIKKEVKEYIDGIQAEEELIVITDIFGGSVNNEFMKYLGCSGYHLIAGLNLPLLIELLSNEEGNLKNHIRFSLNNAVPSIQYCNDLQGVRPEEDNF